MLSTRWPFPRGRSDMGIQGVINHHQPAGRRQVESSIITSQMEDTYILYHRKAATKESLVEEEPRSLPNHLLNSSLSWKGCSPTCQARFIKESLLTLCRNLLFVAVLSSEPFCAFGPIPASLLCSCVLYTNVHYCTILYTIFTIFYTPVHHYPLLYTIVHCTQLQCTAPTRPLLCVAGEMEFQIRPENRQLHTSQQAISYTVTQLQLHTSQQAISYMLYSFHVRVHRTQVQCMVQCVQLECIVYCTPL